MLRQIIRPTSDNFNIHIPKEYINTDIEILVLPFKGFKNLINSKEENEIKTFTDHSANTINEWLDDSEDEIWK